ncbi:MAG TPA: tRNA (cytidine(34)-2'-O)-methyltransferase [Desulfobacteraceae bacterium]|nr:tRNA (cytidine(34)-2'-O)-methyltransferase [Deltaproteobacteria bacterium]RLB98920.1 MAG: tRNA (cytidine(34)-2'-O)-methyltransferase [Deltaproteobacteria bacterium]HDI58810.1 tRNA (cytidine(34)-2'-O)-methyltransferase [Desulfobacteraceae bacterium]
MSVPLALKTEGPVTERHVVLVHPEVHWNTGNIGRTCLGAGARLHLIEPLGFRLDDKHVRRAGLDYWPRVDLSVWADFAAFEAGLAPEAAEMALFTKAGKRLFWEMPRPRRLFLVFGSESRGLPPALLERYLGRSFRIPISDQIRSLNLSTAVGIALYESLRGLC